MTEQNPDLLALKEGLPEGPWTAARQGDRLWYVEQDNADGLHIATANNERLARAIAAIPSMLEEIERLTTFARAEAARYLSKCNEAASLRALHTEMREALVRTGDFLAAMPCERRDIDTNRAAYLKMNRALLAKTETDQ